MEAQEILDKLFPGKITIAEKSFNMRIHRIDANNKYVAVVGYPKSESSIADVYLYDINGNKLWQKEIDRVYRVSMAEEYNKVIVVSDWNLKDEQKNACYDAKGNKLWEIWVTAPGLTLSSDGKYGITTKVSGEEWLGHFQVFDIAAGQELKHPIKRNYRHFFAQFLNNRKVVILLQRIIERRDEEILKESRRLRKEGKDKAARELIEKNKSAFEPIRDPLRFIIYDIPTGTVEIEKGLHLQDGRALWVGPDWFGNLAVSENGQFIAVAAVVGTRGATSSCLQLIDKQGSIIWEKDKAGGIYDTEFIGDDRLVVIDWKNIRLFDVSNGNKLWEYRAEQVGYAIKEAFVQEGHLFLQNLTISPQMSRLFLLDLKTGEEIIDKQNLKDVMIVKMDPHRRIILNKSNNKLEFLK
ncbi:PQQ-binding-like beta-propeller repeat protein [candidate division KSB1 bacterium]|nr:PQQ-binding-like beta-propeller repeat protein [candidate division KSB1 bacterium]